MAAAVAPSFRAGVIGGQELREQYHRRGAERREGAVSPSDREDDAALDDLLQPWSYGATPFLTPAMQRSFSGGGGGAAEPTILEEDAEAEPAAPHPSIFTEQLRPTLLHRPSSLLSRRSIASSITSSTRDRVNEPPRPYNLPPGLAASSPIPPSSSASTLRPPLSTNDSSATAVRKRRSWLGGFVAPSAATTAASQALASAATAQPRGARVQYEPPIPLEVQLLLLTTPPPPRKQRPSTAVLVQERAEFLQGEAAVKRAAKAKVEREAVAREKEKNEKEGKEGLVRRLWSSRLSGIYGGGKRGDTTETEAEMETEDEYVKVQGPSALELGGRRWSQQKGSPGGKIDSKSHKEVVPKTWDEYSRFYAAGQLDIEDPPFPPLSSSAVSYPSSRPSEAHLPSPYEAAHFSAPLHLSPVTPIREDLIAHLDLLGEQYVPQPAPTGALPPVPQSPPLKIITAVSPVPSTASASSAESTAGRRDSLLRFTSPSTSVHDRRDSAASTAPSSIGSPAIVAKHRPTSAIFPSRTTTTLHSSLSRSQGRAAMQPSLSGSGLVVDPSLSSLKNHSALVNLLLRALNAPLGSPALFNPAPKAAVITLFPSTGAAPSLTILASLNIPSHVASLPLSHALDAHAILNGEKGLIILDTERDWRWRGNELVRDGPNAEKTGGGLGIRFYAGAPVFAPSLPSLAAFEEAAGGRIAIGTVALLDDNPRLAKFGASERAKLRSLAAEITLEIERFLGEREKMQFLRRGSSSSTLSISIPPTTTAAVASLPPPIHLPTPSSSTATSPTSPAAYSAPKPPPTHAKKVSFDRGGGGRRGSLSQGYVDYDAQLVATASPTSPPTAAPAAPAGLTPPLEVNDEEADAFYAEQARLPPAPPSPPTSPSSPLSSSPFSSVQPRLPPLLANTPPKVIYASACTSLASGLGLSLVYLVALDLSQCPPAPSIVGNPTLSLLAAHNLPIDSKPSFDPALHLRALRAPEGGLLFRSPAVKRSSKEKERKGKGKEREREAQEEGGSGFASGVLLPVAETDTKGWVLAGYTTDKRRRWGEEEMNRLEDAREKLQKVLLWQENGGWGPDGGSGEHA